ncbi:MAG: efflux RND transporter periplasmic adaptor subunit, partial [Deltaproteobacteria bacterium]
MLSTEMSPARPPLMLAPLLAGLGVLSTCSWGGGAAERTNDSAPVPVTVAPAVQKDAPVSLRAIGNVTAYSTVSLKAQVEGRVARVYFAEGQEVKRGDLLFALDARPFEAALRQAEANLARDRAQAENARVEAGRFARLVKDGIVSQDEYDQAHARAASLEAAVVADQAAVESARIQLQYCSIASPID